MANPTSSAAASALNSVLNHPFWAALIVAIIGGIFTIIAAFIQSSPPLPAVQAPNTPTTTAPLITSTTAATSVVTSIAVAPTSVPTVIPIPDLSTPEGVTAAYLDAWNKADVGTVRTLISQHSLDAFDLKREEVKLNWTGIMSYEIGTTKPISEVQDTVRVPVRFTSDTPLADCCVLRKEKGEWRVNWGYNFGGSELLRTSLIDFREVKSDVKIENGVAVRPAKVWRYFDRTVIGFERQNSQLKKCVRLNGVQIVYFGSEKPDPVEAIRTIDRGASIDGQYLAIFARPITDTWTTSIELSDWFFTDTSCTFPEGSSPVWSYKFEIIY